MGGAPEPIAKVLAVLGGIKNAIPILKSIGNNSKDEAQIIDGKKIAADIRAEIKAEVERLKAKTGKVPGLAVVIVGER